MHPMYFLVIFVAAAPFVAAYFLNKFTRDNVPMIIALSLIASLIFTGAVFASLKSNIYDEEVLNGYVIGKEVHRFECPVNTSNPCENGYSCHCRTIRYSCGKDTCTRTECDRCYRYGWEKNYFVDSSIDGRRAYKISRVDAQGAVTPSRWDAVHQNDPVSRTRGYDNYLYTNRSLFSEDGKAAEKYAGKLPAYPIRIFDYYRIDRIVTVGNVKVDKDKWNAILSDSVKVIGHTKEVNIVIVLTNGVQMDYANALRRYWRGFKKNDVVVFAGVKPDGTIEWSRVMSWSKNSMVNVVTENDLLRIFKDKPLEPTEFVSTVTTNVTKYFSRIPMEEYSYLKNSIALSGGQKAWLIVLWFALLLGTAFGVHRMNNFNSWRY